MEHPGGKACDIISANANGETEYIYDESTQSRTNYQSPIGGDSGNSSSNRCEWSAVGEPAPGIFGLTLKHITNQEIIVDAALTGNKGLALQALVNDPLVRNWKDTP